MIESGRPLRLLGPVGVVPPGQIGATSSSKTLPAGSGACQMRGGMATMRSLFTFVTASFRRKMLVMMVEVSVLISLESTAVAKTPMDVAPPLLVQLITGTKLNSV